MPSDGDRRLTSAAAILRAERNATKLVAGALDCSDATADRIVKTGHAPERYKAEFLALLKRVRDWNLQRAKALDEIIVLGEYREQVAARKKASSSETGGAP
jgi:hypothetical protein